MNSLPTQKPKSTIFATLAILLIAAGVIWHFANRPPAGPGSSAGEPRDLRAADATTPPVVQIAPAEENAPAKDFVERDPDEKAVLRPLPVASESTAHQWTQGDATEPEVIHLIAHNVDEELRMLLENERIGRRQLVYRQEPVFVTVERAKAAGEPLRKLTLPGFDGREVEMEVLRADLAPSGLSGTFEGRLAGRGESLVTLAFQQGREAFTVLSPEDGTFLQGHPREPGEIIITSFDPETYLPVPDCEPIINPPNAISK